MFPVEAFRNTLAKAVAILDRHAIRYHLTGGLTSVLYGEPRMTQDIDIVIDNPAIAARLMPLLASLEDSDFLFDEPTIRRAVAQRSMFQLFDGVEALKLDLYPRELVPGEFERAEIVEVFTGVRLPVVSRADAALSKLIWINKGSHKSRRDVRSIYRASPQADRGLIRDLAAQLSLTSLLNEVLAEPDELEA